MTEKPNCPCESCTHFMGFDECIEGREEIDSLPEQGYGKDGKRCPAYEPGWIVKRR